MKELIDRIYIKLPDKVHGGYGICIQLKDKDELREQIKHKLVTRFRELLSKYGIDLGWFLQGDCWTDGWSYFELLKTSDVSPVGIQEHILKIGEEVAKEYNLPFDIEK